MRRCEKCNSSNPYGTSACHMCLKPLEGGPLPTCSSATKVCHRCQAHNRDERDICYACAARLGEGVQLSTCPHCLGRNPAGSARCHCCRRSLGELGTGARKPARAGDRPAQAGNASHWWAALQRARSAWLGDS
jgi:hypothetical protein